MSEMGGIETGVVDLTEIIGDHDIVCDYAQLNWHGPARPAEWIGHLVMCTCGAGGVRLLCDACHELIITDDVAAFECRHCNEVIYPPRFAFARFERMDKRT